MYKIVKIIKDGVDAFVVIHAATGQTVFESETYDEAFRFVLSK